MRTIVKASLRFRWIVLFLAAATLALGFVQIPETKVDVFPEFAPPQIEIQTIALGNSSNEVEQLITVPIEDQLGGIAGLAELRSKSVAQLSSIRLIFERGTDELRARQLVQERLTQITPTLPTWASPPFMMPALSATSRIMKIGLTSDTVSPTDLSTIAYWKIRARLLRVPGVAQVAIWGERLPQRQVQVDPQKLTQYNVTLQDVMDSAADAVEAGCSAIPRVRSSAPVALSRRGANGSTSSMCNPSSDRNSWPRFPLSSATVKCSGWLILAMCSSILDH
jgi:Cu/Ag efflux pump CusA